MTNIKQKNISVNVYNACMLEKVIDFELRNSYCSSVVEDTCFKETSRLRPAKRETRSKDIPCFVMQSHIKLSLLNRENFLKNR